MRVSILGPLELYDGAQVIEVRGARLRALVARLSLDAGSVVSVTALTMALWDDDAPTDVANALQSLVSRLRRALPDPSMLQSRGGGYLLAVPSEDVDAFRFRRLARDGRSALRAGDAAHASDLLARALALWRGEALADLRDSPFVAPSATALEQERSAAIEDRLDAEVASGRGPDVLPELLALADEDPLRERVIGLLMRALYDAGRQAESLELFERTRAQLAERLGADPSPALRDIHLDLLRGPPVEATRAAGAYPSNLRATLTSFLGRTEELDRLRQLLTEQRLVTLVGPGGAGKTRLALEAAAHELGLRAVWVAELAPVTDPADIAQAVLDAIDVRDVLLLESRRRRPPRDALGQLEDALAAAPSLLVLDNCEHLVDGAARLCAHLLERCPQLRVLATSREPLAITGEVLHPLSMLTLPEEGAGVDDAAGSTSVQLLVDRAGAVAPSFRLDENTVAAVVEICRRLDGLPLAIELAAARLRTMTAAQLAARLDDRFRLLTGGSRTAVARHRTLRAVVEWSWDLLTDEERTVAERFAVFPGGATADAAAMVCLPAGGSPEDAEDALGALVDKSLVQVLTPADAEDPRYRMLETLREFGSERLAARAELIGARRAHARYYLRLAEHAEPLLRTDRQVDAVRVIDTEHDNILAALRFSADDGDADVAVRIAAAMGWYWMLMDSHTEAATWTGVALATPGTPDLGAQALVAGLHAVNAVAAGLVDLGDASSMSRLFDDVPDVDDPLGHPLLTVVRPARAMLAEDAAEFEDACKRSLAHPDPWARAVVHLIRVQVYENVGDVEGMHRHLASALELFRTTGDRWGVAMSLTTLGGLRLLARDEQGALEAHEEAYRLTAELLPRSRDNDHALMHLALVHARLGDPQRARELLARAGAEAEASGSRHRRALVDLAQGNFARLDGDHVAARGWLDSAEERLRGTPVLVPHLGAMVHVSQAQLAISAWDIQPVPDRLAQAYRLARASRDAPIAAGVAVAVAQWLLACGDPDRAAELLGVADALRGCTDLGNPDVVTTASACQAALGRQAFDFAAARGAEAGHEGALRRLGDAIGVCDESGPVSVVSRRT